MLDKPFLTPCHPEAKLIYTECEMGNREGVLGRTLSFRQNEPKRIVAEGNVTKAVGWVAKPKALEDERLACDDW